MISSPSKSPESGKRSGDVSPPGLAGTSAERRYLFWVSIFGSCLLRSWGATLRISIDGYDRVVERKKIKPGVILASWHNRIFLIQYRHRNQQVQLLQSTHWDSMRLAAINARMGYGIVWGSSTRRGREGLGEIIEKAGAGHDIAFTPDGPKGPACRAKKGVVVAASRTGCPIIPIAWYGSRVLRLGSWDGFLLPVPFSRCGIFYGEPIDIPSTLDEGELKRYTGIVEDELNRIAKKSEAYFS